MICAPKLGARTWVRNRGSRGAATIPAHHLHRGAGLCARIVGDLRTKTVSGCADHRPMRDVRISRLQSSLLFGSPNPILRSGIVIKQTEFVTPAQSAQF